MSDDDRRSRGDTPMASDQSARTAPHRSTGFAQDATGIWRWGCECGAQGGGDYQQANRSRLDHLTQRVATGHADDCRCVICISEANANVTEGSTVQRGTSRKARRSTTRACPYNATPHAHVGDCCEPGYEAGYEHGDHAHDSNCAWHSEQAGEPECLDGYAYLPRAGRPIWGDSMIGHEEPRTASCQHEEHWHQSYDGESWFCQSCGVKVQPVIPRGVTGSEPVSSPLLDVAMEAFTEARQLGADDRDAMADALLAVRSALTAPAHPAGGPQVTPPARTATAPPSATGTYPLSDERTP